MFLTLSHYVLTIIWIFRSGLMYSKHVAFLNMGKSSTCQNFKWNVFSKVYNLHSSQFQGLCLMKIFSKHTSKFVILLYESSNSNAWQILYCFSEKIFLSVRNPKIVRSDPTALQCTHTHTHTGDDVTLTFQISYV